MKRSIRNTLIVGLMVGLASAAYCVPKPKATTTGKSKVAEEPKKTTAKQATGSKFPFYVYDDQASVKNHYIPSGWMGDWGDMKLEPGYKGNPKTGKTNIKIVYSGDRKQGAGWAGIFWQHPANNWGDKKGGYDLTGAKRVTFWARGERGGEKISEFKIGGITPQTEEGDSDSASIGPIELTTEWQKYTIDLKDVDLSHIIGGFCWAASGDENPDGFTLYLDEIKFEN